MASNTPNIDLYKKDPTQDNNDTFNIDTMLNENWDKIDEAVGNVQDELKNNITQTTNLNNTSPAQHIVANQNCGIDLEVDGQMVVNLLGRDGDCEDVSKVNPYGSATLSLDASKKLFGKNAIKMTLTADVGGFQKVIDDTTKYYFVSVYLDKGNAASVAISKNNAPVHSTISPEKMTRTGIKLQPSDFTIDGIVGVIANGTTGQYGYADGFMIIEITQDEYNILTVDQLLAKYPYTNSAKPLLNPTIEICGKNLVKNGNCEEGTNYWKQFHSDVLSIESGKFLVKDTVESWVRQRISVKPNTDYYVSGNTSGNIELRVYSEWNTTLLTIGNGTFNSGNNTYVTIYQYLTGSGFGYAHSIQLEQGTTPTTYESYQGGEIIFPIELVKLSNYQDKLIYKNGTANKEKKIKHVELDGNNFWQYDTKFTGYKRVWLEWGINTPSYGNVLKHDGKILKQTDIWDDTDQFNHNLNGQPKDSLYISIANTDSGWGENYTPTSNEIKAYFNGWKMFDQSGGNTSTYNGTGDKGWVEFENVGKEGFGVPTLPTTSYDGFTPYQLYYALAEPIEEEIHPIILRDGFNLVEGQNTIAAKSGMMWEKVEPKISKSFEYAYIAGNEVSQEMMSKLAYQNKKIVSICKEKDNSMIDCTYQWTINPDATYAQGVEIAYIPLAEYENECNYYVLYEVLHEEYDSQLQEVTVSYEGNIRQTLNETIETIGNIQKDISRLHDDWYQVNEAVETTRELSKDINTQNITLTNANSIQHTIANQNCGVDVEVSGEVVVNLLGRDGDCESGSSFIKELDTSNSKFGNSSSKFIPSNDKSYVYTNTSIQQNKKYFISGYVYIVNLDLQYAGIWVCDDWSPKASVAFNKDKTGQWQRAGGKVDGSNFSIDLTHRILTGNAYQNATGEFNLDGIMLNEITQDEYNNLTVDQLLAKYPYNNSAQPLLNPTVYVCGKNKINPERWIKNKVYNSEGVLIDNNYGATNIVDVIGGETIILSKDENIVRLRWIMFDKEMNFIQYGQTSNLPLGITLHNDTRYLGLSYYDQSSTTYADPLDANIQLEQGPTPTPYEPYKGGQIIFPTELAKIDTYQDKLTYKDGVAKVEKEVKYVVFDGSLDWEWNNDYTGFKRVRISDTINIDGENVDGYLIKFNGKILKYMPYGVENTDADEFLLDSRLTNGFMTIGNTDSGWGDVFKPSDDEIKAYFNGWRMYDSSTHTSSSSKGVSFDTFGTKTWVNVNDISQTTNTVPTTQIADDYTPYQLYYALQEPIQEEIQPIILGDGVNLVEGQNTLMVKSGHVLEKANIVYASLYEGYYINVDSKLNNNILGSELNYRCERIINIIKRTDGVDQIDSGFTIINNDNTISYGKAYASAYAVDVDPEATYYVLYEVLQEDYNCQLQETKINYENNIRHALNEVVETTANNEKLISDLRVDLLPIKDKEMAMSDLELLNTDTAVEMKDKINEIINLLRGD